MGRLSHIIALAPAGVMELVDVADSKSAAGDSVPVRVRSPAPKRDIREDVSFFAADRRGYTNLAKITNIPIVA